MTSELQHARAEAVREAASYIERITPKGLVNRAAVLADLEIAADRMGRGIHANGRDRAADSVVTPMSAEDAVQYRPVAPSKHEVRKRLKTAIQLGLGGLVLSYVPAHRMDQAVAQVMAEFPALGDTDE